MTPSEEIAAAQNMQDHDKENLNEAPDSSDSTCSSSNGFRVKNVSEINENVDNSVCESSSIENCQINIKRKLPSWMLSTSDLDENECSKKLRTSESNLECENSSDTNSVQSPVEEESADGPSSSSSKKIEVKFEPHHDHPEAAAPQSSSASLQDCTSNQEDIKPAVVVKKEEATSTSRESCKFGIRCYRRNPMHRIEEAHPGDHDYKRPNFPSPPLGTPDCPYGDSCYRRNPNHFQQFNHPPQTDFEQNWKNYRMRLRQRRQPQNNSTTNDDDNSDLDDYDLEDPFIDDGDEDYTPSEDEDYDECDRAEE